MKNSHLKVSVDDIKTIFRNIPTNKDSAGEIPLQILKNANFSFEELTSCVKYAVMKDKFSGCLKLADVTPVPKTEDLTNGKGRSQMFFKIRVLKNLAIFTERHLRWSLFLIKLKV